MSKKTLSIFLVIAVLLLSYQTYSLYNLSNQVAQAQNMLGGMSQMSLSSGEAPDMVGGC